MGWGGGSAASRGLWSHSALRQRLPADNTQPGPRQGRQGRARGQRRDPPIRATHPVSRCPKADGVGHTPGQGLWCPGKEEGHQPGHRGRPGEQPGWAWPGGGQACSRPLPLTGPTRPTPLTTPRRRGPPPRHSHPIRADPRHLPRKTLYPRLGPDLPGIGPPGPLPCTSVPFPTTQLPNTQQLLRTPQNPRTTPSPLRSSQDFPRSAGRSKPGQ